jgi:hypothetical protein
MIQALVYAALWLLSLFLAFKLGQGSEILRAFEAMLDERGLQTEGCRVPGAPRSSSIFDQDEPVPRPLLTVVEGLEERPRLRVVEP